MDKVGVATDCEQEEAGGEGEETRVGSEGETKGAVRERRPGGAEGNSSSAAQPQQHTKLLDRAAAALRTQEKAKELKHKTACEATRRDFVPFIVSTDGCLGEAAQAFLRRLGRRLAEKWERAYSQVFGFIMQGAHVSCYSARQQPMSAGPAESCTRRCVRDGGRGRTGCGEVVMLW